MTRDVAASVRARLQNQAKASSRPFQEVLQYYGLERFLYRFAQSRHRDHFLLKGALMLRVWDTPESRPTRDIDFLGFVDNEVETIENIVREICSVEVEDDGLRFDALTVKGQNIKEDADYQGVRIKFFGLLQNACVPMQIDIGFGDVVHPSPEEQAYPTILDFPAARLRMYPRVTLIAEKFQAMVALGTLNSRMKDFFDIWLLSRQFDFAGADLAGAIGKTFHNRNTELELEPVALTASFMAAQNTQAMWKAWTRRSHLESVPNSLDEMREPLRRFLLPAVTALIEEEGFRHHWRAPGPWKAAND